MKSSIRQAWLAAIASLPVAFAHGQAAPWKVDMRLVTEPTANAACGAIELKVRDASGKPPVTPDGKQVDWQDFDIALTRGAGPLKLASNGRFLCATAPGVAGVVTAKYPESTYLTSGTGKGRTGKLLIPGVTASATLEVHSAGTAQATIAATSAAPAPEVAKSVTRPAPATTTTQQVLPSTQPSQATQAQPMPSPAPRLPSAQPASPAAGVGKPAAGGETRSDAPALDEATRIEAQKWFYQALVNEKYPPSVAALMTARTTVVSQERDSVVIRQSLVGGAQRDLTIKIKPVASLVPTGGEAVIALDGTKRIFASGISVRSSETGYKANMEFFAPTGTLTAGLVRGRWFDPSEPEGPARVAGFLSGAGTDGITGSNFQIGDAFANTGIVPQQVSITADPPGYRPLSPKLQQYFEEVQGMFEDSSLMRQQRVFEAAERLKLDLEAKKALSKELAHGVMEAAEGAAHAVVAIHEMNEIFHQHKEMHRRLKDLIRCAQNPTNPLAQRARQEDPNYERSTTDVLNNASSELKVNSSVRIVSSALNAVAGMALGGLPAGIASAGIAMAEDAMLRDVAERDIMGDAGKGVVPCESMPARSFIASVAAKYKYELTSLRADASSELKRTMSATGSAPLDLVTLPGGIPAGHKGIGRVTYAYHTSSKGENRDMGTTGRVSSYSSYADATGAIDLEISESGGEVTVQAFTSLEETGQRVSDDGRGNRRTEETRGTRMHGFGCRFVDVDLGSAGTYTSTTGEGNLQDVCTLTLEPQ